MDDEPDEEGAERGTGAGGGAKTGTTKKSCPFLDDLCVLTAPLDFEFWFPFFSRSAESLWIRLDTVFRVSRSASERRSADDDHPVGGDERSLP
jgi:hypothetical protein